MPDRTDLSTPSTGPSQPRRATDVSATFEDYMREHGIPADHPCLDEWRKLWRHELQVEENEPKVIPPCPEWCILPAGHDYTGTDGYGEELTYERRHTAFEGGTLADVSAAERNCYGTVQVDAPYIFVTAVDDERSPEQVRALAAELLEAARVLEALPSRAGVTGRAAVHPARACLVCGGQGWLPEGSPCLACSRADS